MSNVKGAVEGIGEDLVGGAQFGLGVKGAQFGWKKALQMAGKKGATHFAGKTALGKAVPYVGWGLLGYGLYDTADAFVEGYTGTSLNKRIVEGVSSLFGDDDPSDD